MPEIFGLISNHSKHDSLPRKQPPNGGCFRSDVYNLLRNLKGRNNKMKITGKISSKRYRCSECGHESNHSTNHYGQFYDRCPSCSWKSPMSPIKVFECLEPLPEGWGKPEPWKMVKLGDIAEIV